MHVGEHTCGIRLDWNLGLGDSHDLIRPRFVIELCSQYRFRAASFRATSGVLSSRPLARLPSSSPARDHRFLLGDDRPGVPVLYSTSTNTER